MKTLWLVPLLLLSCLAFAEKEDPAMTAAKSSNAFAFDLLKQLPTGKNLFFSPYSVSTALAMTREGTAGETGTEMDRVFRWEGHAAARLANAFDESLAPRTVKDGWGEDAKEVSTYEIHTANTVWAQEGLSVEEGFKGILTEFFGAPLSRIDFRETEKARKIINDWVEKQTKERIKNIVPEGLPTPDTLFALANAIYFKASWEHPFKERFTKAGPFTTAADEVFEASYMNRTGEYRYADTDEAQVLSMPYRKGDVEMIVVLPRTTDGLAKLESGLNRATFDALVAKLEVARVAVAFPTFEIEFAKDLSEVLPGMGMPTAFDARKADFTNMTKAEPLFIGPVLHKAWVKVDEAGTEAAAATVVMMIRGGRPSGEPIPFRADHPFLFAVRHAKTGAILFLGRFAEPE